ncbi:helix-turn-helix domain-containing protein [Rhodocyclus tenuis]|uniref:Transcriptional regulator with XRE-family HTH domain n=1 Tax=Rhodocyclus tenuis TaxID=1066 RepID=A0A840G518_RHOTE|nr:helix-turn-helix transcriptional regulator [Rhodocyclus tenuis]MBB4245838.1 transcriptional regulator with XRE-family HTH domain [Rhodocyclus tenuis]
MAKSQVDDERQRARALTGERLRSARETNGFSQRQVAEVLGLTKLSVLQYEAGRTTFPTDLLPRLDLLGIDSAWVATGIPSLERKESRGVFSEVLTWVRREAAIHELQVSPEQEVDLAWFVFRRLSPQSDVGGLSPAVFEEALEAAEVGL